MSFTVGRDQGCPFEQLEAMYERGKEDNHTAAMEDLPFTGGVIASFNYDLGRGIETFENTALNDMQYPDLQAGLYLWALIIDHEKKRCTAVFQPSISEQKRQQILQALATDISVQSEPFSLKQAFSANVDQDSYHHKLNRIDDYIHAGDCYQVNFAQRFSSEYKGDPWHAYQKLRTAAPTPFAAYLETDAGALLSLSPERFLEVEQGAVSTKPIKGTRPRSQNTEEDAVYREELINSTKDRAENLMIVDLLRNDLSKSCEFGSVKVPKLFDLESYANVHHLVSTVTGTLNADSSPLQLLKNSFPGGSITGAPKLRAMQIIEELEPHRRNIYCGSIGYLSFCGRMDTSITIRTLLCESGSIYCWGGGGIVADSDIDSEYQESCTKVNNLLRTLETTL